MTDISVQTTRRAHGRIIAGVVIAGFCVFLQLYVTQPLLELFRSSFGASEAAASLTVSAATLAVAVASPFVGLLADAIGRKRVIVPCLFAIAAATLGCALSQTLGQLIAFRFMAGVFTPGVIAVTLAYISEETPRDTAGGVTALYVTGNVLGGLCGRIGSAYCTQWLSWHWAFAFLAIATAGGAVAVWLLLPRSQQFRRHTQWRSALTAMGQHLRTPALLATYFVGFCALFCHVGLFTYASFHLARPPFSLSTSALGSVFLVYALGIIVTPLSGRLIDRMGHRFGAMIAVTGIVGGAAITLLASLPMYVLGLAVASTGVFIAQAAAASHIGHVATHSRSAATGLYVACYYLGGSVGATGLAMPWQAGGWPAVVLSLALAQAISATIAWHYFATATGDRTVPPESASA